MKSNAEKTWETIWRNSIYSLKDKIDGDPWVGVVYSPILSHIRNYLSPGNKILEAGCGMGQWVVYLNQLGYNVIGLDFVFYALKETKNFFKELKLICGI